MTYAKGAQPRAAHPGPARHHSVRPLGIVCYDKQLELRTVLDAFPNRFLHLRAPLPTN